MIRWRKVRLGFGRWYVIGVPETTATEVSVYPMDSEGDADRLVELLFEYENARRVLAGQPGPEF